jgi:hypothetical protein
MFSLAADAFFWPWKPQPLSGHPHDAACSVLCKAVVAVGGATCVLSTFSKISRCQFRRHRALLISAIDNRR